MKILFTGTSSFTGYWFIQELVKNGHDVHAISQKSLNRYGGIRKKRLDLLSPICDHHFNCSFGSQAFFDLIQSEPSWDLLCHHAAETSDYKSLTFNFAEALKRNTFQVASILKLLQNKSCNRVLLTGTVFEPGEGGNFESRSVSLYGLSKGLTYQVFKYFTETAKMSLGKFVIPNPFGPYEELRFTSYLVKTWLEGKTAAVSTPEYIRDNIHVDLLAKAYRIFAESLSSNPGIAIHRPSGYIETQGAFAKRISREIASRISIPCPLELKKQIDFSEPIQRFNTDPLNVRMMNWNESGAWDALADYYRETFGSSA